MRTRASHSTSGAAATAIIGDGPGARTGLLDDTDAAERLEPPDMGADKSVSVRRPELGY